MKKTDDKMKASQYKVIKLTKTKFLCFSNEYRTALIFSALFPLLRKEL